ncbi:MAG: CDGSH iron-sulfur domain-containing protein [Candidatus Methanomethylophilaceae archaeon]|jgi:CDGSH-type Zn-finger protein
MPDKTIKITKSGPYIVSGGIPIKVQKIVPKGEGYVWEDVETLETKETYSLCRCGHSKNTPFCDGSHSKLRFGGKEKADTAPYEERADVLKGETLDLKDDGRCALARFCHTDRGKVWGLVRTSGNPEDRAMAIRAACECPAGRLTAYDKDGKVHEDELEKEIVVIQDPEKDCSGGYYVKGGIPLISGEEDREYETRNRYVLCRCGHSRNIPFCDARHVPYRFKAKR